MTQFLDQLQWRQATKAFDKAQPVSESQLGTVLKAVQFAPTSFGLQPFYVKVVKDEATMQALQAAGWGQAQFTTATAVLVFVARTDVHARIEEYFTGASGGNAQVRASLAGYEEMMKGWAANQTPETFKVWAQKQAYIALGFGLAACAELGIDSCPMEGFDPAAFDKILKVPAGHFSSVVLAVGNRTDAKPLPKFRFPLADIAREIREVSEA